MTVLLTLLLLAPDPAPVKVPEIEKNLKAGEVKEALALLKEVGKLKENHAEAKALVKLVRNGRIPKPPEVVEASFLALKGIGSRKITRQLLALLKVKKLKKNPAVRIGICRALQGSADPKAADAVIDFLRDPDDTVVAAAGEAAGAFRYAKEHVRKDLFKTVMGIYVSTWNLKNSVNPEMKTEKRRAERRWEVIEEAMEKTLQLLSNVTQNSPPAWRRWWNKNKNARWAELEES